MHSKSSCPFSYSMCMVIVVEPGYPDAAQAMADLFTESFSN